MSQFTVDLEGFRGPLEVLLDLIERQKLDISDVSLATVSDEYVEYITKAEHIPLSQTAQFVVVAATLLLIKSRSLLPHLELTTEEEADIKDLEQRLEYYRHVRTAARLLPWGEFSYLPQRIQSRTIVFSPGRDLTLETMHEAASALGASAQVFTPPTAKVIETIRLEDVIHSLARRVQSESVSFKRMTGSATRVEAIVHFLALLELVRHGDVSATQTDTFSDILLEHDSISTPHYA